MKKYKNFKKILLFYLVLISLIMSIFSSTVSAVTLCNWDDEIVGSESGTTGYIQYTKAGQYFEVENDYTYSSPYQLEGHVTGSAGDRHQFGWLNLTSSKDTSITKIYGDVMATQTTYDSFIWLEFYNGTDDLQIEVRFTNDANDYIDFHYRDNNGAYQGICGNYQNNSGFIFVMDLLEYNILNYSVYYLNGTYFGGVNGTWRHSDYLDDWSYIEVDGEASSGAQGNSGSIVEIDDIVVTVSGAGQDEGSDPSDDSDYMYCTPEPYSEEFYSVDNYLEWYISDWIFTGGDDITINHFDFLVDNHQLSNHPDLDEYQLYLNGVYIGNPDAFFQSGTDIATMRWNDIDLNIGDSGLVVEVNSSTTWRGYYFDGLSAFSYHSTPSLFGNGIVDGTDVDGYMPFCVYWSVSDEYVCNSYDITQISSDPHYPLDSVLIDVSLSNTDGNIHSSYWRVLNNASSIIDQGTIGSGIDEWGYYLEIGTNDFVFDNGTYTFQIRDLECDDYTNETFLVDTTSYTADNWTIYTNKVDYTVGENADISVYVPSGELYEIRVKNDDYGNADNINFTVFNGVGTGNWRHLSDIFTFEITGQHIFQLFNETDMLMNYTIAFVVSGGYNYFDTDRDTYYVGELVHFTGGVTIPVSESYIQIRSDSGVNIEIECDSGKSIINENYLTVEAGYYTCYLYVMYYYDDEYVRQNWSKCNFQVLTEGSGGEGNDTTPAEDWFDDVMDGEGDFYKPYVGAMIMGLFICIPFGLSATYGIDFPIIGYAFFGVLGLGLATSIGFFEPWIIVLTIIALVVVGLLSYRFR